ncbi:MAG: hypothetical protein KatS3mg009_1398 [Acidimicrobiia bacterium]|nr:MAG: hypothetical protein KatS3mg009_1398 [Acidimicrobiia bacterium]
MDALTPTVDEEETRAGEAATPPAPAPARPDDLPAGRWERIVGAVVVAVATLIVVEILNPDMRLVPVDVWPLWRPWEWRLTGDFSWGWLLRDTTTNGGDMGAHVWWPWFLEQHWFPRGRLSGWAPDWYAGFPVGHYYFPLPAVAIALLDALGLPYNVAFKLVTVSGPVLLPAAAYSFARGLRAPWPAPPLFAVAALGTLVQTRDGWQIYGGNIASTLAGEFSFTLALALGLFALGALARSLDTGRRPWLPALLIAAAAMSHVVVSMFVALMAVLLVVTRRPRRTFPLAAAIGGVALALTAVWTLPLLARHDMTQSMRYTKVVPKGDFELPGFVAFFLPGFVDRTVEGFVRAIGEAVLDTGVVEKQPLWLPAWVWLLAGVAIVAAGWYRRRSTAVLLAAALILGVLFVQWPEHAVWNTRFLPFWVLTWALLAATGAAELLRLGAAAARWAVFWVREGDLHDARARAWLELAGLGPAGDDGDAAPAPRADVPAEVREHAVAVVESRAWDEEPPGWEPPPELAAERTAERARTVSAAAMACLLAVAGLIGLERAWDARDNNPGIAIEGWARWNYTGYEEKAAWPEYSAIMETMGDLPCGRALWEPSAGEDDPINTYGTSLALELLPYWTDGCIGSMEGLYFESSGTTSFHFLTVSELALRPSNPVRGLVWGTLEDFDRGVRHLQMLGVRYYMAWTPEAQAKADAHPDLDLVAEVPDLDDADPKGWRVYEVRDSALVEGLRHEPVVARTRGGTRAECFDVAPLGGTDPEPRLGGWECAAARWWRTDDLLDVPWAESGPDDWERVDAADLDEVEPRRLPRVEVSDVVEEPDEVSFRVDRTGVPVVVKVSYFPNWEAHGARGPYRLAPNLMVVVPTDEEVVLTYGLTPVDWLGRLLTLGGVVGLVALARWKGAARFAAFAPEGAAGEAPGGEPPTAAAGAPGAADGDGRATGRRRRRRGPPALP